MFDIIFKNGTIIDGRQQPRYTADVGLEGDRIAAIGQLEHQEAAQIIDVSGLILAPGFIDVHTHSDGWLRKEPHFYSKTSQGFTTEFLMLDGISYAPVNDQTWREWFYYLRPLNALQFNDYNGWQTIGEYMAQLDQAVAQNVAAFIPYANVRTLACGFGQRFPDDYQTYEIKRQIEIGMADGALGLSTGLDYVDQCFATTEELITACRMMAPHGVYVTHVRYALGTLSGVKEAVWIGKQAGVPVHISHLKAVSEAETEAILNYIDNIAINEVSFSFDVYPYLPSSTMLQYLLPYEVWLDGPLAATRKLLDSQTRAHFDRTLMDLPLAEITIAWVGSRANAEWQGQSLADFIAASGKSPAAALCDLLIEEGMAVLLVFHLGADELIAPFLTHDSYMMGSDGIFQPQAPIHPRQFGSVGRFLGHWVRQQQQFSLETAVYKMTGLPAVRFNLKERGEIREGFFADLVLFDAAEIESGATYAQPQRETTGIKAVVVNGQFIIKESEKMHTFASPLPGRYLPFGKRTN